MSIEVIGRAQRLKRELCTSLGLFVLKEHLPAKRIVDVNVYFRRTMQDGVEAMCHNMQPNAKRPSVFEIEIINELSVMRSLVAMAHEMVHVVQYATGRYAYSMEPNTHMWDGIPHVWIPDEKRPFSGASYWNLPWEIDAHGRQYGIVYLWMEENSFDNSETWYESVG